MLNISQLYLLNYIPLFVANNCKRFCTQINNKRNQIISLQFFIISYQIMIIVIGRYIMERGY